MEFKDLSFSFEAFEAFIADHNIQINDSNHSNLTNQEWLEYFRQLNIVGLKSHPKLIIRPVYYYGDTIIAFLIEEKIDEKNSICYYWGIIY